MTCSSSSIPFHPYVSGSSGALTIPAGAIPRQSMQYPRRGRLFGSFHRLDVAIILPSCLLACFWRTVRRNPPWRLVSASPCDGVSGLPLNRRHRSLTAGAISGCRIPRDIPGAGAPRPLRAPRSTPPGSMCFFGRHPPLGCQGAHGSSCDLRHVFRHSSGTNGWECTSPEPRRIGRLDSIGQQRLLANRPGCRRANAPRKPMCDVPADASACFKCAFRSLASAEWTSCATWIRPQTHLFPARQAPEGRTSLRQTRAHRGNGRMRQTRSTPRK